MISLIGQCLDIVYNKPCSKIKLHLGKLKFILFVTEADRVGEKPVTVSI